MKTALQHTLDALNRVYKDKGYSNITLDSVITQKDFNKKDIRFVTALFYGVLDRSITLDHIVNSYSKKQARSLDIEVLNILRMGIYQLIYLNSVPDNAAVDESVKLAGYAKKTSAKGFINAILRGFIRDNKQVSFKEKISDSYKLSVELSIPEWIISLWSEQFSKEQAVEIAKTFSQTPKVCITANLLKISRDKLIESLADEGIKATADPRLCNTAYLSKGGNIRGLKSYKQGLFHVQDISSAFCASVVAGCARAVEETKGTSPKPLVIIDSCAAPGGKTATVAQLLGDRCRIYGYDVFPHKLELIKSLTKRLGIETIKPKLGDSSVYDEKQTMADVVLCDVPCSGLGIIGRKPEIKLKPQQELEGLPNLQLSILTNCSRYVKIGGYLIYSTCTINKHENDEVCDSFLTENDNFVAQPTQNPFTSCDSKGYLTLLPHISHTDGFFIAKLKRVR